MSDPTEKDIKEIASLFGTPVAIPGEFARWMADQFALAVPSIPITQLFGARSIERLFAIETDSITVSGGTETTLFTTPIPGKSIAQNGRLKLQMPITLQDSAGTRQGLLRVKLNGSTILSHPIVAQATAADPQDLIVHVWNRDQYDSQVVESRWLYTKQWAPATVDLAAEATLTVTYQHTSGDANDILVRKAAFATLYNPSD